MTVELFCVDCDATLQRVFEGSGRPKRCDDCRKLHTKQYDADRMKVRCEEEKAKRLALRDPNCLGCGQLMVRDDSNPLRMDMCKYCSVCLNTRKRSQDSRRFNCKPMAEIKREAAERHAAQEVAKAILRAKRRRQLAAKRRKCPWLNPKLTDAQAYRLQYKLDADFRTREVARSVKRHQETPLLRIWEGLIARCENPNTPGYHRYGGRGIKVLEPFRSSFQAFVDHIGPRPSQRHSVDRIDPDGHYTLNNVRWSLPRPQANNKSTVKDTGNASHCHASTHGQEAEAAGAEGPS